MSRRYRSCWFVRSAVVLGLISAPSTMADAAVVSSLSSQPVSVGTVVAGRKYRLAATGVADLFAAFNGGQGRRFTPAGKPTYPFPPPYTTFWPNGLDYDPSNSPTAFGLGGPGKLIGALMYTFTASPGGYADYKVPAADGSFTATSTGSVYAMVNDCPGCYVDNAGNLDVSLVEVIASAVVSARSAQPIYVGAVVAGRSYRLIATGQSDLYPAFNGGQGLPFTPAGKPTHAFPSPYAPFWPDGLDYDPSNSPTAWGVAGPGKSLGSLVISFAPAPTVFSDYQALAANGSFLAPVTGPVYALVNDCPGCYVDNSGSIDVTLIADDQML